MTLGMFDDKKARASKERWEHFDARVLDCRNAYFESSMDRATPRHYRLHL